MLWGSPIHAPRVEWTTLEEGLLKLNKMSGGKIVEVFEPDTDYFLRKSRKTCLRVPTVFTDGIFRCIKGADYSANDQDVVCMGCFGSLSSGINGQSIIEGHAKASKAMAAELLQKLKAPSTSSTDDARRVIVSEDGSPTMTFEQKLPHHVALGKWLTNSGRPYATINDIGLRSALYNLTADAAKTTKVQSELSGFTPNT